MLGITGTGGAGKCSLTDELIRRLRLDQGDALQIAVISHRPEPAQDRRRAARRPHPHERDRPLAHGKRRRRWLARLHALALPRATPAARSAQALPDVLAACKCAGFDLVVVETSGIGQGDAAIVPLVDVPLYVMTPEFGAASQLEKIDMLDFAEFVAINKFDRKGAADALRDVAKQVQRNREAFDSAPDEMPVFGTMASRFNDDGVTALYQALQPRLAALGLPLRSGHACRRSHDAPQHAPGADRAGRRARATWPRSPTRCAATSSAPSNRPRLAREIQQLRGHGRDAARPTSPNGTGAVEAVRRPGRAAAKRGSTRRRQEAARDVAGDAQGLRRRRIRGEDPRPGDPHRADPHHAVGHQDPQGRAAALRGPRRDPALADARERARAAFPTPPACSPSSARTRTRRACSPAKATPSAPTGASSCCRAGMPAKRLSTAFDSVTLYGNDPDQRPDIYGKVGNSGVSIATLDDMKVLYSAASTCAHPATCVSMTINGPAPTILAMFMNTAIDQQLDKFRRRQRPRADRRRSAPRSAHGCWRTCAARCRPTS